MVSMIHKVKIINTHYFQKHHLIVWDIKFTQKGSKHYGQQKRVAYRANDLASALLGRKDIVITPQQAIHFNSQIKGKQKSISFQYESSNIGPLASLGEQQLGNITANMKQYPYQEIFDAINQGKL